MRHLGAFPLLEDQMCAFTRDAPFSPSPASGGGRGGGWDAISASPDRVDALVWALSDLLVSPMPHAGIFDRYRELAASTATER